MKAILWVPFVATAGVGALVYYLFFGADGPQQAARKAIVAQEDPGSIASTVDYANAPTRIRPAAQSEAEPETVQAAVQPAVHQDLTPKQESERNIAEIKAKGSDGSRLFPKAHEATKEWSSLARSLNIDVRMGDWDCFTGGCTSNWVFTNEMDIETMTDRLMDTAAFRDWPGAKFRSGPLDPTSTSGKEVTWVLFADEQPSTESPL